jgi:predicted Rossmann fold nucleotide-binding protein DprA/Smf involved in DNA uptake
MNNTAYNTAPFIIGITGHRDLQSEDIETLRISFNNLLDQLAKLIPNTQIRVVSGMADGADRVAASVAIERGILVEAVSPLYYSDS